MVFLFLKKKKEKEKLNKETKNSGHERDIFWIHEIGYMLSFSKFNVFKSYKSPHGINKKTNKERKP